MRKTIVGVIGAAEVEEKYYKIAEEVGKLLAKNNIVIVCGGMGGVMEAVAKGAKSENGITIGILPGISKEEANPYIDFPIVTGMGHGRNIIIARTADAFIAISGEYGTLSEIAFALKLKKVVIGIDTWDIKGVIKCKNADEAIETLLKILKEEEKWKI